MPLKTQRIYFANHSSHLDTLILWAALPQDLRVKTRAVAAKDYWGGNRFREYIARRGFNAILIERKREDRNSDPLEPLIEALKYGDSLIFFPEGTRHAQKIPGPFKSGLYYLAERFPEVELIPVYLENSHRSMPKGTYFPVPLICTARFGAVLKRIPNENKEAFLERAHQAIGELI